MPGLWLLEERASPVEISWVAFGAKSGHGKEVHEAHKCAQFARGMGQSNADFAGIPIFCQAGLQVAPPPAQTR